MIYKRDVEAVIELADKFHKLAESMEKFGEAHSRQDFRNRIEHILTGAAIEFYKCRLNDKLDLKHDDRWHWEKEWTFHLGGKLQRVVFDPASFKNKEKALLDSFEVIKSRNNTYLRVAANTIAMYCDKSKIKPNKVLDDTDTADFYAAVEFAFKEAIEMESLVNK
jgi:hypothetical protein